MSDDYAIYVGGVRYVKGDRIEELEAQNELLQHMIASLPPPHPDNTLRNRLAHRRAMIDKPER